jgi:hypothetical protein
MFMCINLSLLYILYYVCLFIGMLFRWDFIDANLISMGTSNTSLVFSYGGWQLVSLMTCNHQLQASTCIKWTTPNHRGCKKNVTKMVKRHALHQNNGPNNCQQSHILHFSIFTYLLWSQIGGRVGVIICTRRIHWFSMQR